MENASQALIIAGTILIAMIVLSVGVYLVANYSRVGESYEQTQIATEITKFNANFLKFAERTDITAQEIATLYNFVKNYNTNNDPDIEIIVPGISTQKPTKETTENIQAFIIDSNNSNKRFKCLEGNIKNDGPEGRVSSIKFEQL